LNYEEYKNKLKDLRISSLEFMNILEMNEKTPATNWRRKNQVPKFVEVLFDSLNRLPESDRVLFVHEKLKESQKKQKL
jgi:hypothetical protein